MVFFGGAGAGKTHLAVAVVRAGLGRLRPFFLSHGELLERYRLRYDSTLNPDEPRVNIISECRDAGLLVLDDLGRRQAGRDEEGILHAVLNHRYEQRQPTILTTNLDLDGLHAVLGDALFDRLSEVRYAFLEFGVHSLSPASPTRDKTGG